MPSLACLFADPS